MMQPVQTEVRFIMMRRVFFVLTITLVSPSWAQTPDPAPDPDAPPPIRFTPDMARGLARRYAHQLLTPA